MSRIRTGIKPGQWQDEGPSSVRQSTHIGGEQVVGAPTPGAKNDPWISAYHDPNKKKAQQRAWKAASRERRYMARVHIDGCALVPAHRNDCRKARVLCDWQLKKYKELGNCARTKGHGGRHQSRQSLDRENEVRRDWRAGVAA